MSSQLNDDQKSKVTQWVEEGADLNAIQNRLQSEFDLTLSFMETRFLISDLDLEIKEEAEPEETPEEDGDEGEGAETPAEGGLVEDEAVGQGGVTVTMDSLNIPGTVASGKVTFSDGKSAQWYIDQMGQLGLTPEEESYRPSEADVIAFQDELQRVASQQGL